VKLADAIVERTEPIRESVVANAIGEDVVAVHSAAGAVDEWITQAAYRALESRTEHAAFRALLGTLLDVKSRHELFWRLQARDRLARSASAAALARRRLARTRFPLGTADEAPAATARFLRMLDDDAVAAIDARVDDLTGLAGLGLARRTVDSTERPRLSLRIARLLGRTAADATAPFTTGGRR
jgi:hypothetical protein